MSVSIATVVSRVDILKDHPGSAAMLAGLTAAGIVQPAQLISFNGGLQTNDLVAFFATLAATDPALTGTVAQRTWVGMLLPYCASFAKQQVEADVVQVPGSTAVAKLGQERQRGEVMNKNWLAVTSFTSAPNPLWLASPEQVARVHDGLNRGSLPPFASHVAGWKAAAHYKSSQAAVTVGEDGDVKVKLEGPADEQYGEITSMAQFLWRMDLIIAGFGAAGYCEIKAHPDSPSAGSLGAGGNVTISVAGNDAVQRWHVTPGDLARFKQYIHGGLLGLEPSSPRISVLQAVQGADYVLSAVIGQISVDYNLSSAMNDFMTNQGPFATLLQRVAPSVSSYTAAPRTPDVNGKGGKEIPKMPVKVPPGHAAGNRGPDMPTSKRGPPTRDASPSRRSPRQDPRDSARGGYDQGPSRSMFCLDYNGRGCHRASCLYRHVCSKCEGRHRAVDCPRNRP
jgi:hypothetical protein